MKPVLPDRAKANRTASHWAVCIGYDGYWLIFHDPGTDRGYARGANRRYSTTFFKQVWDKEARIYIPISR